MRFTIGGRLTRCDIGQPVDRPPDAPGGGRAASAVRIRVRPRASGTGAFAVVAGPLARGIEGQPVFPSKSARGWFAAWRRLRISTMPSRLVLVATVSGLPACAPSPLVQGTGLSSYDAMVPSDGLVTKSQINVNKAQVLEAKTVRILPTAFPPDIAPKLTQQQRDLVANSVNRGLCVSLSDRFEVVPPDAPADLTVKAAVTQATETDEVAAGLSAAASIGASFIDVGVPIPTPRIPVGLGNLSMEAEAIDAAGRQQASMLWARGANAFFSSPRASKVADAYELADAFGEDFGHLLVKGQSPFGDGGFELPSAQRVGSAMGLPPKHAACERYGLYPGLAGVIGGQLGLPPEWTDSGAKVAGR